MAYTRHGVHIPGSDVDPDAKESKTLCGGIKNCVRCKADVVRHREYYPDPSNTAEPLVEVEPRKKIGPLTHSLGINVMVSSDEEWERAYGSITRMSARMGRIYPSVTVHSYLLDDEPGVDEQTEYFDAYTVPKVRDALMSTGLNRLQAEDAITAMEMAGILFRERS
jgi:hypothetical protein